MLHKIRSNRLVGGSVGGVGVHSVAEARHGRGNGDLRSAVVAQVVHGHGVRPVSVDGCVIVVHALEKPL